MSQQPSGTISGYHAHVYSSVMARLDRHLTKVLCLGRSLPDHLALIHMGRISP